MKLVWLITGVVTVVAVLVLLAGITAAETDVGVAAAAALSLGICVPAYILARAIEGMLQPEYQDEPDDAPEYQAEPDDAPEYQAEPDDAPEFVVAQVSAGPYCSTCGVPLRIHRPESCRA